MNEREERFRAIEEIEPDAADLQVMARLAQADDTSGGISLAEMDALREAQEYSGKISLRLPRTLHRELAQAAKAEGVSLNQFLLYKLAK